MLQQATLSEIGILRTRTAVVGVRVNTDATTGGEQSDDLDVFGIHQTHQVFHDRVHAILMEIAVIAEGEEIEFQALRLDHPLARDIEDLDFCEVRLSCDRTERCELWTVELYPVIVVRMTVLKGLQHLWGIVGLVLSLLTKGLQALTLS